MLKLHSSCFQIGVTEPRRVAATTLASRVAEEKSSALGDLVGYSIRFDERFDRSRTRIKYMTEGILVREMLGDPLLKSYAAIMLDEVHERTAQVYCCFCIFACQIYYGHSPLTVTHLHSPS